MIPRESSGISLLSAPASLNESTTARMGSMVKTRKPESGVKRGEEPRGTVPIRAVLSPTDRRVRVASDSRAPIT